MQLIHHNFSIDSPTSGAANGDAEDQPIDDGSKGELVIGPGAGGMQPRPSEVKKALPPLTYQQEEMLKKAKRYAMEQSVQQVGHLRVLHIYMCTKPVATDCRIDCCVPFQNNTAEVIDLSEYAIGISHIN